jgi:hypothetical protein
MEIFRLEDCAIELITEAASQGLLKAYDTDMMVNLLTPQVNDHDVTYKQYVNHIKRIGPPRYIAGRRVTQAEYAKYIKNRK